MEIELIEDKIKNADSEVYLSKDYVLSFIMLNWKGEESNLFGDKYELAHFVDENYFTKFNCERILPEVFKIVIRDFKKLRINKFEVYIDDIQCKLKYDSTLSNWFREHLTSDLTLAMNKLYSMKKYIKEEMNEY